MNSDNFTGMFLLHENDISIHIEGYDLSKITKWLYNSSIQHAKFDTNGVITEREFGELTIFLGNAVSHISVNDGYTQSFTDYDKEKFYGREAAEVLTHILLRTARGTEFNMEHRNLIKIASQTSQPSQFYDYLTKSVREDFSSRLGKEEASRKKKEEEALKKKERREQRKEALALSDAEHRAKVASGERPPDFPGWSGNSKTDIVAHEKYWSAKLAWNEANGIPYEQEHFTNPRTGYGITFGKSVGWYSGKESLSDDPVKKEPVSNLMGQLIVKEEE